MYLPSFCNGFSDAMLIMSVFDAVKHLTFWKNLLIHIFFVREKIDITLMCFTVNMTLGATAY